MNDTQQYLRGQIYWRKPDNWEETPQGIIGKCRPVVIVSGNTHLGRTHIATVVPLTTAAQYFQIPTHIPLHMMGKDSLVMCEQVYTCNTYDLAGYIGTVTEKKMEEIDLGLKYAVGLIEMPDTSEGEPEAESTDEFVGSYEERVESPVFEEE